MNDAGCKAIVAGSAAFNAPDYDETIKSINGIDDGEFSGQARDDEHHARGRRGGLDHEAGDATLPGLHDGFGYFSKPRSRNRDCDNTESGGGCCIA